MRKRQFLIAFIVTASFIIFSALPYAEAHDGEHEAATELLGTWAIDFIAPISPKGNNFGQPHRHRFKFSNDDGKRTVVAIEILDLRVPGVWRASGDQFSATFEFTCPEEVDCGTITMRGQLDSENRMSGRIVIFWDTPDNRTPTGYDTNTGTFTGEKCGGVKVAHDTGGC